jgi:hypothetical protein
MKDFTKHAGFSPPDLKLFCPFFYRINWTFIRVRLGSVFDENNGYHC